VFSASVTDGFPPEQISLDFVWKWPPPVVQPHHSHYCFSVFLITNVSLVFTVVKPPLYQCSRRWIHMKPFSYGMLKTGAWICCHILNHAKALLCGRRHFWKLRILAGKIGNMKIYHQFWNLIRILLSADTGYMCVVMLCSFLIFYRRKCINPLWTPCT
jgi:hypothetical protein